MPLTVFLSPEAAEQYAEYKLTNLTTNILEDEAFPFESPKIKPVTPGIYSIEFHMTAESNYNDPQSRAILVESPEHKEKVSL